MIDDPISLDPFGADPLDIGFDGEDMMPCAVGTPCLNCGEVSEECECIPEGDAP